MIIIAIISWIVFGFIVGLVARALYPGTQSMGFVGTTLLGVVGSFAGGTIGNAIVGSPVFAFQTAGLIGSTLGALLVLLALGLTGKGRVRA